jgi:hypothetical protein
MASLWRLLGRRRTPRRVRLRQAKCSTCHRRVWMSTGDTQCHHCAVRQLPPTQQ